MDLKLLRLKKLEDRTLGILYLVHHLNTRPFVTMELAWKENKKRESCIPLGKYDLIKARYDDRKTFMVKDVPGRSGIYFHAGNWPKNSTGCILLGSNFVDYDNSISASVLACTEFEFMISSMQQGEHSTLEIYEQNN